MKNTKTRKRRKGFTLIELTFVMATLIVFSGISAGVIIAYSNYKISSEAGQKLQNVKNMVRATSALRIPIDAADPKFGTNVTALEKINTGQSLVGTPGIDLTNPNGIATLVTYMNLLQNGNASSLDSVYGPGVPTGGKATISLVTNKNPQGTIYYMRIINGRPVFTERGQTAPYDPSDTTTDGLWDAGH